MKTCIFICGFVAGFAGVSVALGIQSDRLSLADANAALAASGGLTGKVFAVGDNRYVVRRSRLTGSRGNVFIGEIEIAPLPKQQGGLR